MIVHSYIQTPGGMGLGDFIRGSLALHQLSMIKRFHMIIAFKDHPVGKYLMPNHYNIEDETHDLNNQCLCLRELRNKLNLICGRNRIRRESVSVLCNTFPRFPIRNATKNFVKNSIRPTPELENAILANTPGCEYEVVHIRFGDLISYSTGINHTVNYNEKEMVDKVCGYIENIKTHTSRELLLMCDSNKLKKTIGRRCKIKTSDSKSVHCNIVTEKESDGIIGTLVDFFILTRATHIHQFSVHGWGSTFSNAAHWIYDVPMYSHRLLE